MKKVYLLLFGVLLIVSCKETKTKDNPKPEVVSIKKGSETQVIVQKILDLPKLQWMFHPEVADRLPIKLVENRIINDILKLQKFDKSVRIATKASFEKEKIRDYLVFEELILKVDTAYFAFNFPIEGVTAKGKLVKISEEWTAQEYTVSENHVAKLQITSNDSIRTLAYKGADLSYLSERHYGDGHYKHVLASYNGFANEIDIDKKHDSIKIPRLSFLQRDPSLPKLKTIAEALDKVNETRNVYLIQGRTLWDLPFEEENRDFRLVPNAQKIELLGASKLMYECVAGLEQHENPPKKAIGQFRQVAENLENIANGKIDENGYALDMVHQRLARGFSNCIKWAKEPNKLK
mgnify:FL=1